MAEQEKKQKKTEGPPSGEGGQPSTKVTEKGKKLKEEVAVEEQGHRERHD